MLSHPFLQLLRCMPWFLPISTGIKGNTAGGKSDPGVKLPGFETGSALTHHVTLGKLLTLSTFQLPHL